MDTSIIPCVVVIGPAMPLGMALLNEMLARSRPAATALRQRLVALASSPERVGNAAALAGACSGAGGEVLAAFGLSKGSLGGLLFCAAWWFVFDRVRRALEKYKCALEAAAATRK